MYGGQLPDRAELQEALHGSEAMYYEFQDTPCGQGWAFGYATSRPV